MKALVRFLAWLVGGLLVLAIVLGIALKIFIDPNDYRDEISAAVADATGRTLIIEGELSLQVFPCCGIQLGPLELSNPEGFDTPYFVRVENAGVSVRIMPMLLRQELVVGEIELDGLDLNLITRKDGSTNWEFGEPAEQAEAAQPPAGSDPTESSAGLEGLNVAGISITDGRILYRDDVIGDNIEVTGLSLETDAISDGEHFNMKAGLNVTGLAPDTIIDLEFSSTAALDVNAATVDLRAADIQLDVTTPDVPGGNAQISMQMADVSGVGADRMAISGLVMALQAAGLVINVNAAGEIVGATPSLSGDFAIEPFSPRQLLKTLGEPPMKTADPAVLGNAVISAGWALSGDVADLSNFKLTLDDTNASGSVKLASIENQAIEFDLQFDAIDLDRYMEPVPEAPAGGGGGGKSTADEPLDLPVEDIRALDLAGRLGFGKLRVTEALLTNVEMRISAKTGLVRLHPFTADVYGGKYTDDLRLNVRGAVPKVILNTDLKNFQVGEYLADTEDYENLTGTANLKLKANTSGNSEAEMTKNLRGNVSFDVEKARYVGTDLWHEIRVAKARIKGDKAPPAPAKPYTDISQFKGTAKITNGVVKNKDFVAMIPLIRLTGAGDINLVNNQIDYNLQAQVTGEKTFEDGYSMGDLEGLKIPVKVKGDLEQPSFSVDLGAVLGEIAKQQARKKLLEKFGIEESGKKDGKKGGKQKSKEPKEQLKEGLRDLFR